MHDLQVLLWIMVNSTLMSLVGAWLMGRSIRASLGTLGHAAWCIRDGHFVHADTSGWTELAGDQGSGAAAEDLDHMFEVGWRAGAFVAGQPVDVRRGPVAVHQSLLIGEAFCDRVDDRDHQG